MSKRAEEAALKAYPPMDKESHEIYLLRDGFINGYDQAEKEIISHIRKTIKLWMPEKDGEEYTDGKRLAFNSVLHLLKEIEEEQ